MRKLRKKNIENADDIYFAQLLENGSIFISKHIKQPSSLIKILVANLLVMLIVVITIAYCATLVFV